MNELIKVTFEEPTVAKLSNSKIKVIKNKTLLAPGFWNGRNYTKEEIIKAFHNTNWEDKDVISLVADHRDDDSKGRPLTIRDWLGFVSNPYVTEDGYVKGDLNICDSELALRLVDGKAPFGISPFVQGRYDKLENAQKDFVFKNFAIVVEPACKECYINEYLSDDQLNEKLAEISAFERIRKRLGMSVSEFYAVPRDPPSSSKLPIFDKAHVRNAMARFNQTDFNSKEEREKAKRKIMAKAKKFGIEVKEFGKLGEVSSDTDEKNTSTKKKKQGPGGHTPDGTGPHGRGNGPGQGKKDGSGKLNSIKMKGGKKLMTEEIVEKTVEQVEAAKEPETTEESEESSESEQVEEETEDKLVEQIASLTEKLMNKRKLTPEMAKMQKLEKEVSSLKKMIAKLQEEKDNSQVESKEGSKEESEKESNDEPEKLSAKPKSLMTSTPKESTEFTGLFKKGPSQGTREAYHKLASLGIFR